MKNSFEVLSTILLLTCVLTTGLETSEVHLPAIANAMKVGVELAVEATTVAPVPAEAPPPPPTPEEAPPPAPEEAPPPPPAAPEEAPAPPAPEEAPPPAPVEETLPAVNTPTAEIATEEDKNVQHEPATSVGLPIQMQTLPHVYHEHSGYHTPAMANGQSHYNNFLLKYPFISQMYSAFLNQNHRNPDPYYGYGNAHRNPTFPAVTITGMSSYSNSDREHVPALAVSSVHGGKLPEHSPAIANPSRVPHPGSYGSHHQTHTPAFANPSGAHREHSPSIWNKATKHGVENTEKMYLKFPFSMSAVTQIAKPFFSKLRASFPGKPHPRIEGDDLEIDESSLPVFNETDSFNTTNLMKFEEVVQTNRQRWEIPIDENVMQSEEFKAFWKVYQKYLEHQMHLLESKNPQAQDSEVAQAILDELPRPESAEHVYTNYLEVYKYCKDNKQSIFPLYQEDTNSCRHFFKCYRGQTFHFHCARGTAFSSHENKCLFTAQVKCGLRP